MPLLTELENVFDVMLQRFRPGRGWGARPPRAQPTTPLSSATAMHADQTMMNALDSREEFTARARRTTAGAAVLPKLCAGTPLRPGRFFLDKIFGGRKVKFANMNYFSATPFA